MTRFIEQWPGNIPTISGGTRNMVNLSRPWQTGIRVEPDRCPFEPEGLTRANRDFADAEGGWRVLKNISTPYSQHFLIIPQTCWRSDSELRTLGGEERIATVLRITERLISGDTSSCQDMYWGPCLLTVHIGPAAGQNLAHLHWHLILLPPEPEMEKPNARARVVQKLCGHPQPELVIKEVGNLQYRLGGHRAGQGFILPRRYRLWVNDTFPTRMAWFISWIIKLYLEKFRSVQGFPPDFHLSLRFGGGECYYGVFTPILNQWGATEEVALLGDCPITLPWPHEVTAAHLRGTTT